MDVPLEVASTSDADERELLEAANPSLYWDRVVATSHLDSHLPDPLLDQSDDMKLGTSLVHRRSAQVEDANSFALNSGLHTPSSSAARVSLRRSVSGNATTPGWTGPGPPTSSPVSPLAAASLSVSYLPRSPSQHRANENHLISSPDPLQLLSLPARRSVDVDNHNRRPTDHNGLVMTAGPDASPSSSSRPLRESSPRQFNLRQRSSSPDPFVVPAPPIIGMNHDQISALENGASAEGGRYSMRTRQPRQLKPYAFDRLEYTYQLKHHPDAIVNFRGHRNPVESSSSPPPCSDANDTDDAVEDIGGERPSEDPRVLPHAEQKKRHRTKTKHPSAPLHAVPRRMSGLHRSMESPSLARRGIGSPASADRARLPHLDNDDSPVEASAWYPDAFNEWSSGLGSDDALPLSAPQNDLPVNHTLRPRVKRRRRALRQLPHLSPLASRSSHSSDRSSPYPKPASLGAISLNSSSDEGSPRSESTGGSEDVTVLSDESAMILVDGHSPVLPPKQERSPPQTFQKRGFRPSKHPVITDFFVRGPREKKKRPRKRRIVSSEKASRSKRAFAEVGAKDLPSADRRNPSARVRRRHDRLQRPADLSVFTVGGGRVLSGWQRRNAVTIDTEDIAFRKALEPLERHLRPPPVRPQFELPHLKRPPRKVVRGPIDRTASSSTSMAVDPVRNEGTRHRIVVDFDIPFLSSGKVYAASSYLGKGWLYELLSIVSGTPLSHPPPAVEIDGHRLSSISSALDYTVFLPYTCDSFARVLNDPLAMSHEAFTSWNGDMHAVCSLVSWIVASAPGDDAHLIRAVSLEYTGSLIARIDTVLEDSGDRAKSLCPSVLCLYWFAIELLVRSCCNVVGIEEDLSIAISARIAGMASRLLQVGLQTTVSHVANDEHLDDFSLYPCVAELWICLVHLGTIHGRAPGTPLESHFPSIVDILQQSLAAAESSAQGGLQASEGIWCTLIGLCALSQFSAHGLSTSSARMCSSWELVVLSLDYIRLVVHPQIDSDLSGRSLRRRDAYIRLVVSRCLILHQRWGWRLDDDASATLLRRLVEIFKSRKFADLRGEVAGFAAFVQENDARLLTEHASRDSTFTIFLKLIFASAEQMRPSLREDEYLGRTKKLLSLVTPVGSVQLSALRSPFDEQLSMLYNRYNSLVLAIRILPSVENVLYRVSLARRYVDFGRSAAATRSVCIRAANYLVLQALDMALPVGPALDWTSEIARVLISEFRAAVVVAGGIGAPPANDDARRRRSELVQCIQLVLSGLQDMSRTVTISAGKDTSTALGLLQKGCLFPVLAEAELCAIPTIQTLLQGIVDAHLKLALSLQEEAASQELRPKPQLSNQEESQDEYGQFDLNWDDPMVLAALDNATMPAVPVPVMAVRYTYQSLIEYIKNAAASPVIFETIISSFENQQRRQQ
ncbi:Mus7/MMS22 family-domain-containing protein [Russula dissimulans]|nr:Mus7/MMS22 family-domain-containing protein [Russula dissimulans]